MTRATLHAVAAVYPYSTLSGTATCSSHSVTALHETYIARQEESGCVTDRLVANGGSQRLIGVESPVIIGPVLSI